MSVGQDARNGQAEAAHKILKVRQAAINNLHDTFLKALVVADEMLSVVPKFFDRLTNIR